MTHFENQSITPNNIRIAAEQYALGEISLTEVADIVKKLPLKKQPLIMAQAMIHAQQFSERYDEWVEKIL